MSKYEILKHLAVGHRIVSYPIDAICTLQLSTSYFSTRFCLVPDVSHTRMTQAFRLMFFAAYKMQFQIRSTGHL